MHVAQFFNPLLRSTDVEIIEAPLPYRTRADAAMVKQPCESLLDDFHYYGRIAHIQFGDQEVKVLRHDEVADHHKSIFLPSPLKNPQEEIAARAGAAACNSYRL